MPRAHTRKPFNRPVAVPLTAEVMPATEPPVKKAMSPITPDTQALAVLSWPGTMLGVSRPSPNASNSSSKKVAIAATRPAQMGPQRALSRRSTGIVSRS